MILHAKICCVETICELSLVSTVGSLSSEPLRDPAVTSDTSSWLKALRTSSLITDIVGKTSSRKSEIPRQDLDSRVKSCLLRMAVSNTVGREDRRSNERKSISFGGPKKAEFNKMDVSSDSDSIFKQSMRRCASRRPRRLVPRCWSMKKR